MLANAIISDVETTTDYFMNTADDYYTSADVINGKSSLWYGKTAEKLGLSGTVKNDEFKSMLLGSLSNGEQVGLCKNGEIRHRPGIDITFSANKSWSVAKAATIGEKGHEIFEKIFLQAVKDTIDVIEKDVAMANGYADGKQFTEMTGNLAASLFMHFTSREKDPHDHVHAVIHNVTERKDGKFRALKSDARGKGKPPPKQHQWSEGFIERFRARSKDYDAYFTARHGYLAQEAGMKLDFDDKGNWRIAGVSQDLCDEFSTRRKQITEEMNAKGVEGARAASISNIKTRKAKSQGDTRQAVIDNWNVRFAKYPERPNMESIFCKQAEHKRGKENNQYALAALEYAISDLSEKTGIMTEVQLITTAMREYRLSVSQEDIIDKIKQKEKNGELYAINDNGNRYFISEENLKIEQKLTGNYHALQGKVETLTRINRTLTKSVSALKKALSSSQLSCAIELMQQDNKLIAVDGISGSGKSVLSKELVAMLQAQGFNPVLLTPRAIDASEISDAGIKAMSVSAYIKKQEVNQRVLKAHAQHLDLSNEVMIVDDAHRLSPKQGAALLNLQAGFDARSILMIDGHAPESLSPGSFIKTLNREGMSPLSLYGRYKSLENFEVLQVEESSDENRALQIANDAAEIIISGQTPLVVAQNKSRVQNINTLIQQELCKKRHIKPENIEVKHYAPVFMTKAALTQVNQYKLGQLVRFSKTYNSIGVQSGHYYQVASKDSKTNELRLKDIDDDNNIIFWNPEKIGAKRDGVIKVFAIEHAKYHVRDKVFLDSSVGNYKSGKSFTLHKITKRRIHFLDISGRIHKVKHNDKMLNHINLGYAKTPAQAINQKADIILAEQLSNKRLTNAKSYYQVIGQAKLGLIHYVDNSKGVQKTLETYSGDNRNITDALLEKLVAVDYERPGAKQPGRQEITASKINRVKEVKETRADHLSRFYDASKNIGISQEKLVSRITQYAINNLSQTEAVFNIFDIRNSVVNEALKINAKLDVSLIDSAVKRLQVKRKIIPCKHNNEVAYTTPYAIRLESSILRQAKSRVNNVAPIIRNQAANKAVVEWQKNNIKLTDAQALAVKSIITTSNQLILVNGLAGVGKTTMLEAIDNIAKENGYSVVTAVAPTHKAVSELRERNLNAATLDSYISELKLAHIEGNFNEKERKVIVIDESSMASSAKLNDLLTLTANSNHRLAFVGDIMQLPSIDQGKMFWFLQKAGIETVHVNQIIRQQGAKELLHAINLAYQGKFDAAIDHLDNLGLVYTDEDSLNTNTKISKDSLEALKLARLNQVVVQAKSKSQQQRVDTAIITPANKARIAVNTLYRNVAKEQNILSGKEYLATILVNRDLLENEKVNAANYKAGRIIRFDTSFYDSAIKKGDYLTVKKADLENNYITLTDRDGRSTALNLDSLKGREGLIKIFEAEERPLCVGERIRWRYTDKKLGRINMDEVVVTSINDKKATVIKDNKMQTFNYKQISEQHWDHAYASTVHTVQGATAEKAIAYFESFDSNLTTQSSFLVALTRAKKSFSLVTDDKQLLIQQLELGLGQKTSALEALGHFDFLKKQAASEQIKAQIQEHIFMSESYAFACENEQNISDDIAEYYNEIEPKTEKNIQKADDNLSKNHSHIPDIILRQNFDRKQKYEGRGVAAALSLDTENVATHILGKPKNRSGANLFFGNKKGSLVVGTSGKYHGRWKDFATGEGGDLVTLIMQELNLSYPKALEYGAKLIRHIPRESIERALTNQQNNHVKSNPKDSKTYQKALRLINGSRHIKGTLAEKYLTDVRGISQSNFCKDVRFHPAVYSGVNKDTSPALLIIAPDKDGKPQAVQAIFLDNVTGGKRKPLHEKDIDKQSFGATTGALFCADASKKTKETAIITEGPEDALSVQLANPNRKVFASFGIDNMASSAIIKDAKHIILALDNDGLRPHELPKILDVAEKIQAEKNNLDVWLSQPAELKRDYNKMLKEDLASGKSEINKTINAAKHLKDIKENGKECRRNFGNHKAFEIIKSQQTTNQISNQMATKSTNNITTSKSIYKEFEHEI